MHCPQKCSASGNPINGAWLINSPFSLSGGCHYIALRLSSPHFYITYVHEHTEELHDVQFYGVSLWRSCFSNTQECKHTTIKHHIKGFGYVWAHQNCLFKAFQCKQKSIIVFAPPVHFSACMVSYGC